MKQFDLPRILSKILSMNHNSIAIAKMLSKQVKIHQINALSENIGLYKMYNHGMNMYPN